jgi:competence CoiA-like predicted nuclease
MTNMPFVALNKTTRQRVDITKIENPRLALKSEEHVCQLCEQPMIVRAALILQPHFAHRVMCPSDYGYHPESQEHRAAKRFLAQYLRETYEEYTTAQIEFEVPIREAKRVADILVEFPMGWRIAHEIQLASITTLQLQERTSDYVRAGIDVIWWLGKAADTETNRDLCLEEVGFCGWISIYQDVVSGHLFGAEGESGNEIPF